MILLTYPPYLIICGPCVVIISDFVPTDSDSMSPVVPQVRAALFFSNCFESRNSIVVTRHSCIAEMYFEKKIVQ